MKEGCQDCCSTLAELQKNSELARELMFVNWDVEEIHFSQCVHRCHHFVCCQPIDERRMNKRNETKEREREGRHLFRLNEILDLLEFDLGEF